MGKKREEKGTVRKRLGKALEKARVKKGLSREELAERAGTNEAFLSCIENGVIAVPFKLLAKLAAGVGVRASRLMQDAGLSGKSDIGKLAYLLIKFIEEAPPPEKILTSLEMLVALEEGQAPRKRK